MFRPAFVALIALTLEALPVLGHRAGGGSEIQGHASLTRDYCDRLQDVLRAAMAQLIVIATIESRVYREDGAGTLGPVYTDMTLAVVESLKGSPPDNLLRVLIRGGRYVDESGQEHFQGVAGFDLPFYDEGDRVLVYLRYGDEVGAYRVVYQYFKLEDGWAVDGRDFDPAGVYPMITEARVKELVGYYVTCSAPIEIARRADAIALCSIVGPPTLERRGGPQVKVYDVTVDELLGGSLGGDAMRVVTHRYDRADWKSGDSVLLFLDQADGEYRIVDRFLGHYVLRDSSYVGLTGTVSAEQLRRSLVRDPE